MRLVVLSQSQQAVPFGYDVRLGPLAFVTPADTVSETIGDGLEAVGAGLVPTDRRPRPLKLKLPVRGYHLDIDPRESGRQLRRQVRQVLDNARWRLQGFYFVWTADPDLDGWLMIGGAELSETDPGISFGEFEMDLSDVYIVGRPGTHRPGRRAIVADRRGGLVARDTRRLLYSTDFSSQALPTEPIALPGDLVDLVRSGNQPVGSVTVGPLRGARRLWRTAAAADGEIFTYLPDEALLTERTRYLDLDDLGAVRIWDLSAAAPYPPVEAQYTTERDTDPDIYWGWEHVLGDVLTADRPLAIDNGAVRLIWLGPAADQGLAVEYWDAAVGHYRREGRVLHALGVREQRIIEATPERVVVEWRAGQYALRAILQRGWWGPRLESYDDGGSTARLEWAPQDATAAPTVTAQTPAWVRALMPNGILQRTNLVTNPSGEVGTAGWSASATYASSLARSTGQAVVGSASILATPSGSAPNMIVRLPVSVTAGIAHSFQIRVYATTTINAGVVRITDPSVNWEFRTTPNAQTITGGQWTTLTINNFTPPTSAAALDFGILTNTTIPASNLMYFDAVIAEATSSIGAYFDGDTPDEPGGYNYRWTDTPHASTSVVYKRAPTQTLWASASNDETVDTVPAVIADPAVTFRRARVLVGQLSFPPGPTASELASLSLVDAQPVPVLVGRR